MSLSLIINNLYVRITNHQTKVILIKSVYILKYNVAQVARKSTIFSTHHAKEWLRSLRNR